MTAWDAARWHAATGELDGLLGRTAAERAAALDGLRARDPRLADDVARLLRDHDAAQAGGFLEQGPDALLTTASTPDAEAGPRPSSAAALPPGTEFGGYRVHQVLGRGGMALVYDAEEIESGRRVALKVLEQRLGDARERERFEREGRLAASIDHEHCVFVFGAAEIHGVPAIAMERMQGTLADRLAAEGSLPPAAAVDVALQLIAGLQAAAEAGILHRDVKPSNCFVDADGVVKIGDFGISRSLRPADQAIPATRGAISATPMYAPPEQLRGESIDLRADIYSLGATLYELLTGRRPFVADDLMALLMQVASAVPTPPRAIDGAIPRGLSDVVQRCMAKRPEQRFADYASLAAALAPYGTAAPTPATLGRRLLAGAIDHVIISTVGRLVLFATVPLVAASLPRLLWIAILYLPMVLYYGATEGRWSRSPGKAICRLTVVDTSGRPVRGWRAWIRAACLAAMWATILQAYVWATWNPMVELRRGPAWRQVYAYGLYPVILGIVFVAARRRNGYAAVHDLATGTRVVAARDRMAAPRRTIEAASRPAGRVLARHGAFVVHDAAIDGLEGWRPGFDERLRRLVWIRELPPDTPSIPPHRAAISRPTRLRWLAGRRGDGHAWDVYEGAGGQPLARACATPRSWREVHGWLLDLAQELDAQRADDRPPLGLDRVWILDSGRAKLLDDPTMDMRLGADDRPRPRVELLRDVAQLARRTGSEPWPVEAGRFVEALASPDPPAADEVLPTLRAIGNADQVTRTWRALSIGGQLAIPLVLVGGPLLMQLAMPISPAARESPRITVFRIADALDSADRRGVPIPDADREAMELVLASRYRMVPGPATRLPDEQEGRRRARVQDILRRHPTDAGVQAAAERPAVKALIEVRPLPELPSLLYAAMLLYDALVKVSLLALASAIVARCALLRLLGFEIVTAGGPASRLRVTARTAIAWAAVLGPAMVFAASGDWYVNVATNIPVAYAAIVVQLTGAAIAIAQPFRGLQDHLAGTWIVPR